MVILGFLNTYVLINNVHTSIMYTAASSDKLIKLRSKFDTQTSILDTDFESCSNGLEAVNKKLNTNTPGKKEATPGNDSGVIATAGKLDREKWQTHS